MISQLISSLFPAVFLLSAVVQYHDPGGANDCCAVAESPRALATPGCLMAICLLWLTRLLPRFAGQVTPAEIVESLNMQSRSIEEAGEIANLYSPGSAHLCL